MSVALGLEIQSGLEMIMSLPRILSLSDIGCAQDMLKTCNNPHVLSSDSNLSIEFSEL